MCNCVYGKSESEPTQSGPTIQVTGSHKMEQRPNSGRITVMVQGAGSDRESAWVEFRDRLNVLKEQLGKFASVGNAVPSETQREITKTLRTMNEFVVTADIEVNFPPGDFGNLVAALVANDLEYSTPTFEFDSNFSITAEMLAAAAADATEHAAAIAQGVGASIGRLVSINIGQPRRKSEFRTWPSSTLAHHMMLPSYSFGSLDLDEEKFETFDLIATVTAEYEVIESVSVGEITA